MATTAMATDECWSWAGTSGVSAHRCCEMHHRAVDAGGGAFCADCGAYFDFDMSEAVDRHVECGGVVVCASESDAAVECAQRTASHGRDVYGCAIVWLATEQDGRWIVYAARVES